MSAYLSHMSGFEQSLCSWLAHILNVRRCQIRRMIDHFLEQRVRNQVSFVIFQLHGFLFEGSFEEICQLRAV